MDARVWTDGGVLWFTGLSGSGKSTIAAGLAAALSTRGVPAAVLDGDVMRKGLCADLGYSPADRAENLRRLAHVAGLMAGAGVLCIAATISPLREHRAMARGIIGGSFREVHIATDLATCEARDPKGLYRKARAGIVAQFTGVSAPYEPPLAPDLSVETSGVPVAQSVGQALRFCLETFAR
jgi:adenylyl-sulfate kinase